MFSIAAVRSGFAGFNGFCAFFFQISRDFNISDGALLWIGHAFFFPVDDFWLTFMIWFESITLFSWHLKKKACGITLWPCVIVRLPHFFALQTTYFNSQRGYSGVLPRNSLNFTEIIVSSVAGNQPVLRPKNAVVSRRGVMRRFYQVDSEKAFIAKTMGVMQCFWSQKLQAIR